MSAPEDNDLTEDPQLLSVVVIGRNEGARLRRCLQSVAAMECDGFRTEVIYVDSGSSDASLAVAEAMGVQTVSLRSQRLTAALGRNAGWRAARGATVMFLDGDTLLHPTFVLDSLPELAAVEVAVVWGHRRELYPERSVYNRVLDLDWIYPPGKTAFCGGDALFRRSVLVKTSGFDETLIAGEEPELCRRIRGLGGVILHVDRSMTQHDLAITQLKQYWKRAMRTGHAYAEVSERFARTDQPFWKEECERNRNRALVLLVSFALGLGVSASTRSFWPTALVAFVFLLLDIRTAVKSRWKTGNITTLLLYGAHAHLQQIPAYLGQLQYHWYRKKGRPSVLLEYKEP